MSTALAYRFTSQAVGGAFSVAQRLEELHTVAAGDFPGRGLAWNSKAGRVGVGGWNVAPPRQPRMGGKATAVRRIWAHGRGPPPAEGGRT